MDYLQYLYQAGGIHDLNDQCFKPCYKWITFNTSIYPKLSTTSLNFVLNLVINGLPSIQKRLKSLLDKGLNVLNLVINGLPSILN